MSSNQARNGVESWSLRRRLIFEQIVLLALVCVIIVLVTEIALRAFLLNQLDQRVDDAVMRAIPSIEGPLNDPGGGPGGPPRQAARTNQAPGTMLGVVRNDTVLGALRTTSGGATNDLPATEYDTLLSLPVDAAPTPRDLGDFGQFRLIA